MESIPSSNAPFTKVVVRLVKDLDRPVRLWVCSLFGRELADDEQVTVGLPDVGASEVAQDRAQARRRLLESMDQLSSQFGGFADEQLDVALDKAMQAVRPIYEPRG